jgi:hypothetical protein
MIINEYNSEGSETDNKNKGYNKEDNTIEENEVFLEEKLYNNINDSTQNEYIYESNAIKTGIKIKNMMNENNFEN